MVMAMKWILLGSRSYWRYCDDRGKGTLLGTGIGVIFLGLIKNGLDILGVSPYWQGLTVGVIIILKLVIDRAASREKKRKIS